MDTSRFLTLVACLNQPIWKNMRKSNWIIFLRIRVEMTNMFESVPPSGVLIPDKKFWDITSRTKKRYTSSTWNRARPRDSPVFSKLPKVSVGLHAAGPRWLPKMVARGNMFIMVDYTLEPFHDLCFGWSEFRPCFEGLHPTFTESNESRSWLSSIRCMYSHKLGDFPFRPNHHPFLSRWYCTPRKPTDVPWKIRDWKDPILGNIWASHSGIIFPADFTR